MQLMQLLGGAGERVECLRGVAAHLRPGGRLRWRSSSGCRSEAEIAPLPDVREVDGWVYSSLPLDTRVDAGAIVVRRLRQVVSPEGELSDEINEIPLRRLPPRRWSERPSRWACAGWSLRDSRHRSHVGSTVVLLEKEP